MLGCFNFLHRSEADAASDASSITLCVDDEVKKGLETTQSHTRASSPVPTGDRLAGLRRRMTTAKLDLYIVTSQDAHGSEYVAERDQLRAFISGFTGSAGTVIVTQDFAGLWVDGRYHVQADQQVDSKHWTVFKLGLDGVPSWEEWIKSKAFASDEGKTTIKVGGDSRLLPYTTVRGLLDASTEQRELISAFDEHSLVTDVWKEDFPTLYPPEPDTKVQEHPLRFAGQDARDKIDNVARYLRGEDADKLIGTQDAPRVIAGKPRAAFYVVDALDEVAWLLNLRANPPGIPNNPVFPAYVVVTAEGACTLFTSSKLIPSGSPVHDYLTSKLNVLVAEYNDVWPHLRSLPGSGKAILSEKASYALVSAVSLPRSSILAPSASPLALWKSCKNPTELAGMRAAYHRDGVAWARWASWLEEEVVVKKHKVTEYQAVQALEAERAKLENYAGFEAYDAIAGTGENAASPHYETPVEGSAVVNTSTPFLMDSGGQYLDGTIDTTRTVHFGKKPSKEQVRAYTRVLQGHIALDSVHFPAGKTTGSTLDVLARRALWGDGLDYLHGT